MTPEERARILAPKLTAKIEKFIADGDNGAALEYCEGYLCEAFFMARIDALEEAAVIAHEDDGGGCASMIRDIKDT